MRNFLALILALRMPPSNRGVTSNGNIPSNAVTLADGTPVVTDTAQIVTVG